MAWCVSNMDNRVAAERAQLIREQLPEGGLFQGHKWRIATSPFTLPSTLVKDLEKLGRVLLRFYQTANLLYHHSCSGKLPDWIAHWLNMGKPDSLINIQGETKLKSALPNVIRPDILLTENGWSITELDSVPGGIGLTAWLNRAYTNVGFEVIGGASGMTKGFEGIFRPDGNVHVMVSDESATYRPEMEWICSALDSRFSVHETADACWSDGDSVYRFFELFDLKNISCWNKLQDDMLSGQIILTPPPKPFLEEKMLLALLWNGNLTEFWQRELGGGFFRLMRDHVPRGWVMDPAPLPPHAALPGLDLTSWVQLRGLSQRERSLVIKKSGFSNDAWGARSVHMGIDLPQAEWAEAVDQALDEFDQSPFILQQFHKPRRVEQEWFDFEADESRIMNGRVRLCPYYFVGNGEKPEVKLGGVMATVCPADKKIIHGMSSAILAPCSVSA